MNINLRHIRALDAIARHRSFSTAAAALGIVPSALSEVIRQLETAIEAPLFDRGTRPPRMTPLALEFLRETEPFLDGMDRAITRLRQGAGLERGSLAIGASPSAISDLVAPVLAGFLADKPGIDCELHDDIAEHLAEMVSDGRLDMAIAGRAHHSPDLSQHAIMRDPIGVACRSDHPLAARGHVRMADIDPQMLIGLDPRTGTYELLKEAGLPVAFTTPRLRAYSTVAQLCMIRSGLGIGLLPRNAMMLFHDPSLSFVVISDLDLWRTLYLLEPTRRPLSTAAQAFVAALSRHIPELAGAETKGQLSWQRGRGKLLPVPQVRTHPPPHIPDPRSRQA